MPLSNVADLGSCSKHSSIWEVLERNEGGDRFSSEMFDLKSNGEVNGSNSVWVAFPRKRGEEVATKVSRSECLPRC